MAGNIHKESFCCLAAQPDRLQSRHADLLPVLPGYLNRQVKHLLGFCISILPVKRERLELTCETEDIAYIYLADTQLVDKLYIFRQFTDIVPVSNECYRQFVFQAGL